MQILTASGAVVKTTTPELILGAFYFPSAAPPGIIEGVGVLTMARVEAVNICFITPQQTIYYPRTRIVQTRVSDTQMHN